MSDKIEMVKKLADEAAAEYQATIDQLQSQLAEVTKDRDELKAFRDAVQELLNPPPPVVPPVDPPSPPVDPPKPARVVVDGNKVLVDGKPWATFHAGALVGGDHLTVKVSRKDADANFGVIADIDWGETIPTQPAPTFNRDGYPRYFTVQSQRFGVVHFTGDCGVASGNCEKLCTSFDDGDRAEIEIYWSNSVDDLQPKIKELDRFRAQYPMRLKWEDRRPIGLSFPNQYRGDGTTWLFQWKTPKEFEQGITTHIDACIKNCQSVNAQGLIVWSIEGQYLPLPTSYIGDPERASEFAPEMTRELMVRLFKRITDSGLRAGVLVRPNELTKDGDQWHQRMLPDDEYLATLRRKIRFARETLGCRLFYIDTIMRFEPGDWQLLPPFELIAKLQAEFPDCLLIPEQWTPAWFSVICPFLSGLGPLQADWKYIYPDSFAFLFGQNIDWTNPASAEAWKSSIAQGNIPTFTAWWASPELQVLKGLK